MRRNSARDRGQVSVGKLIIVALIVVLAIWLLSTYLLEQKPEISLDTLLERNPDHRALYNVTMQSMGRKQEMQILYAKKGENIKMQLSGESGKAMILLTRGKAYQCSALGGAWRCNEVSPETIQQRDLKYVATQMQNVTFIGTRRIAGHDSYCWEGRIYMQDTVGAVEVCITEDGIPTLIATQQRYGGQVVGTVVIRAVEISYEVADSEFEVPV